MASIVDDIAGWQARFYAQPKVWIVVDRENIIEGVYESNEAAQLSIDWHATHAPRERLRMYETPICSLQLSKERWT